MRLRVFRRCLAVRDLLVWLLLGQAAPVSAHAVLVRANPEANAALDRSPAQVELFFSEAVEPAFSQITVLDSSGKRVDNGDSKVDPADPTRLSVSLRSLKDGVYTVSWKVLSAVDSHPTEGAYPFAVGSVDANALAQTPSASSGTRLSPGEIIVKGLAYLASAALAGGTLFSLLVWTPALAISGSPDQDPTPFPRFYRSFMLSALGLLALAGLAGLLVQAGIGSNRELAPPWDPLVLNVLVETRYGVLVIARFALLLVLTGLLLPPRNRWNRTAALPFLALLLLTISLGSHAASASNPDFLLLADLVHLAGASVWVGGLFLFLAGLFALRALEPAMRTRLTAALIPRFSALALTSVGCLGLTGLYAALVDVGSFQALFSTQYGNALVAKTALFLPMLGLGAYNLLRTTPRMRQAALLTGGSPARVSFFRRLLTGEVALGVLVLLWVGVFTSLPPAVVNTSGSGVTRTAQAGGLKIRLQVTPGRVGINTFVLEATENGLPVIDTNEVLLRFTPLSANLPPSDVRLVSQGNGKYTTKGASLSLPDRWQVQAIVRRPAHFDVYANFQVDAGAAASAGGPAPLNRIAGILLVFVAAGVPIAISLNRPRLGWLLAGQAIALALILAALLVFNRTVSTVRAEPANPVAPNAEPLSPPGRSSTSRNAPPATAQPARATDRPG